MNVLVTGFGAFPGVPRNPSGELASAVRAATGPRDVDGRIRSGLKGPRIVEATIDVPRLAAALGAGISDDAGRYVCNAWLYRVAIGCSARVGFVHVPPSGLDPARLLQGLRALLQPSVSVQPPATASPGTSSSPR